MSRLDEKGRCCGRKPLVYRGTNPHKYCDRCNRAFDSVSGEQIENWAYSRCKGCGYWIKGGEYLCGECSCEEDGEL